MMRSRGEDRPASKMERQCQGAAMKGCQPALFLILPYIQGVQVQAMETSSIHPEKEVEVRTQETGGESRGAQGRYRSPQGGVLP